MFILTRKETRLIVLQRIEFLSVFLKKIRKLFGRYFFSVFISRFFLSPVVIGKAYYQEMQKEYETFKHHIDLKQKNILSIGGGLGGLELILNKELNIGDFTFIERNFVSRKVKYGWDENNNEAYNDLNVLKNFLLKNNLPLSKFTIFDYDNDTLPNKKFDLIISLFSLDYHYNFDIYLNYLKNNSHKNTKIIFDTIRANYFNEIFKEVNIINDRTNTLHKSKRIICNNFLSK